MNKLKQCNKDHKARICVYNSPIKYLTKCYECNEYNNYTPIEYTDTLIVKNPEISQSDERVTPDAWKIFGNNILNTR